ncbi:uncharacterized protein IWZ02DRAFT_236630 [Phyllosticta citriasiana]|uniref:uncharacterized protein n=1 Tax=Phyllosticta citriasiana TaxID=595635 RepID=UPI0030FD3C4E
MPADCDATPHRNSLAGRSAARPRPSSRALSCPLSDCSIPFDGSPLAGLTNVLYIRMYVRVHLGTILIHAPACLLACLLPCSQDQRVMPRSTPLHSTPLRRCTVCHRNARCCECTVVSRRVSVSVGIRLRISSMLSPSHLLMQVTHPPTHSPRSDAMSLPTRAGRQAGGRAACSHVSRQHCAAGIAAAAGLAGSLFVRCC